MCRHFARGGEVGGQDHFLHHTVAYALQQLLHANVVQAHAIQRIEFTHEHEVQPIVGQGALNGRLVGRCFDHAQLAAVAGGVVAGGADFLLGKGVAQGAVVDVVHRVHQRLRQLARAGGVVLQQVVCHARSRFCAYAGQAAQRFDQAV